MKVINRSHSESVKELYDHEEFATVSPDALLLRSSLHQKDSGSEHFLLLGDQIMNGDAKWGNSTPQFGEISLIDGYWDWLEDVLAWNKDLLTAAKIYDAVFASLFTYDRNTNLIRSFCELWCPSTNSLHVPAGEVSISLWDIRIIGGLSINGTFYDEVVPSAKELAATDRRRRSGFRQNRLANGIRDGGLGFAGIRNGGLGFAGIRDGGLGFVRDLGWPEIDRGIEEED
ncbi:hypothetical protein Vadar_017759 [Vaccinium darrowii]|nr:hypothetical protein Vadar_017759 [Vaccinium darrowii]